MGSGEEQKSPKTSFSLASAIDQLKPFLDQRVTDRSWQNPPFPFKGSVRQRCAHLARGNVKV